MNVILAYFYLCSLKIIVLHISGVYFFLENSYCLSNIQYIFSFSRIPLFLEFFDEFWTFSFFFPMSHKLFLSTKFSPCYYLCNFFRFVLQLANFPLTWIWWALISISIYLSVYHLSVLSIIYLSSIHPTISLMMHCKNMHMFIKCICILIKMQYVEGRGLGYSTSLGAKKTEVLILK